MSSLLKELGVLIFSAGEEIEKKAAEFKAKREERFKEFDEKVNTAKEDIKTKYGGQFGKVKDRLNDFVSGLGMATKEEIKELRDLVKAIDAKLESMGKKEP
ncbi:MAG: hypothetical protein E4H36_07095 [Spirochaetales bacterium]|nr:MAG: hypothetical protein E4H36_07095 [Spirochaetales bacterium]